MAAPHFEPWQAFVDSQPFTEGLLSSSYYPGPSLPSHKDYFKAVK